MDNVRQIPGYYYDTEKNKYFKIQPGTSTSAYSSRDVKRRKVEEADAKLLSVHHARQKARVKRHNVLSASLGGGVLYREFGLPRQDLISQIFAEGLVPQKKLDWSTIIQGSEPSIFTIQSRPDIGPSTIDHHIANENELVTIQYKSNRCSSSLPNRDRDSVSRLVFNSPGRATSVCTHEESQKVVMTWLAGQENAGIAVTDWRTARTTSRAQRPPSILIGPGTSRGAEVSVFSSAAAPPASSVLFAIGTSHGLMKIDKQSANASWLTPKLPRSENEGFPRDTFALHFLRNDPSVLLSGGRRGILNITDLRFPVYGDQADTIRHPNSITHIKQLNNHQILVAGLNSSLCHYDLRFRKVGRPENCVGRHAGKNPRRSFTSPFLQYPDYFNASIYQIGLDIDNESGLVAAAQQSKSGWEVGGIHLYSLRTGQLLKQIGKEKLGLESVADGLQVGRWMQSIQFVRNCENKAKSLYIGPSYSQDTIIFSL